MRSEFLCCSDRGLIACAVRALTPDAKRKMNECIALASMLVAPRVSVGQVPASRTRADLDSGRLDIIHPLFRAAAINLLAKFNQLG
jgi:hypothetical protein